MESPPPQEVVAPVEVKVEVEQETLEAKIRKSRPPPRVRISSTSQPGFVSLRLEGVAVTFRNQEVIKDATWDVKTGDRIGLVGPNGKLTSVSPGFKVRNRTGSSPLVNTHVPRSLLQLILVPPGTWCVSVDL